MRTMVLVLEKLLKVAFVISLSFSFQHCQTIGKQDKTNYLTRGNNYAKDGLWREAIDSYKKALAQTPNNQSLHRNIGMVYVMTGDYKNAKFHLEESIDSFSNDFTANFYLGEANRGLRNFADAIFYYKQALKIKEDNIKALRALSWSYFNIRYYSETLATIKNLLRHDPKDTQTNIILARTLIKLKRPEEALTIVQKVKSQTDNSYTAYLESLEGDIYFEMGDQVKAINTYYSALKKRPLMSSALLGLGRCLLEKQKIDKAITYLERAVRTKPDYADVHYLLGRAYEGKDVKKSIFYYQQFKKLAATDPELIGRITEVKNRLSVLQTTGNNL